MGEYVGTFDKRPLGELLVRAAAVPIGRSSGLKPVAGTPLSTPFFPSLSGVSCLVCRPGKSEVERGPVFFFARSNHGSILDLLVRSLQGVPTWLNQFIL